MKILVIVSKITDSGGVSSVLACRLNYLADILGYEVFVFSTNDISTNPFFTFSEKITFHFSKVRMHNPFRVFNFLKEVKQKVLKFNPDFITVADNGFKSLLIKKVIPKCIPCVYELHAEPNYFYGEEYSGFKRRIVQFFIDRYLNNFDQIVSLKNVSASYINQNKLTVIANPNTLKVSRKSNLNNKKVVTVGRLEEVKNLEILLLIWKEILKKFPNYILEIYGEGSKLSSLNKIIESEKLNKNIAIFSPVKDIASVLTKADVFVLTSKSESFSLVTLEAMSCGLPVISFNIGMEHLIENNKTGFIVNDFNTYVLKLIELLENNSLRSDFGKAASEKASDFTIENKTEQWIQLFKKIKTSLN